PTLRPPFPTRRSSDLTMPTETFSTRSPRARILVVDDDASTREIFGELLQRWGYDVEQTSDGHDALKLTAERRPDVIISDLVMPKDRKSTRLNSSHLVI